MVVIIRIFVIHSPSRTFNSKKNKRRPPASQPLCLDQKRGLEREKEKRKSNNNNRIQKMPK